MTSTPEIPGYQLDQRLLEHPLAEIWRGRSFTGMEIVALVLTESGAIDPQVRERLGRASRGAALEPEQQASPLWAANFTTPRPYAITQLLPGQSGAERLLDPLDGVLGNDEESLAAVRSQLAQYGAALPPADPASHAGPAVGTYTTGYPGTTHHPAADATQPGAGTPSASTGAIQPDAGTHEPGAGAALPSAAALQPGASAVQPGSAAPQAGAGAGADGGAAAGVEAEGGGKVGKVEAVRRLGRRMGRWVYVAIVVGVLIVFSVTYSIGAAIGSAVKDPAKTQGPPPTLVSPGPLPSPGLLPGIVKITAPPPYLRTQLTKPLIGAAYPGGADVQVVDEAGLPFVFGWPQPPFVKDLGASASSLYRQVLTGIDPGTSKLNARIAAHPCSGLAACLADRAAFERQWTTTFKAPAPTTAKDGRTWLTEQAGPPYTLAMSHAFQSGNQWWLIGVAVSGARDQEPTVQQVVNDIWWQTQ